VRLSVLHPPTCVGLRYGPHDLDATRLFSAPTPVTCGPKAPPSRARLWNRFCLAPSSPRPLGTSLHLEADLGGSVPPSLCHGGTGMFTGCPSPTPLGLGLGPANPTRIDLPSEPSGVRRMRFSRLFRYSCRHSHLSQLHTGSPCCFNAVTTLPYRRRCLHRLARGFGGRLQPRYIVRAAAFDQ